MRIGVRLAGAGLALTLLVPTTLPAQSLPVGEPEALGFSPERLATMEASLERFVEEGQHAGIVWLVARRGEIVFAPPTGYVWGDEHRLRFDPDEQVQRVVRLIFERFRLDGSAAAVVRYQNAVPLLVDCDPVTLNMDLADAQRKIEQLRVGQTPLDPALRVVGMIPVHVGGLMIDMDEVQAFAARHRLWVVQLKAHIFREKRLDNLDTGSLANVVSAGLERQAEDTDRLVSKHP